MAGILKTLNDDAITNLLNVISGNTDATAKLAQALGTLNTTNIENLLKLLQNNNEAFQTVLNNLPSAKLADLLKNFNSADLPSVIENLSPANLTKALEDMTASNVAALMYGVDTTATCSYTDLPTSNWAYQYIATATKLGWIAGYSDGSCRPGSTMRKITIVTAAFIPAAVM